MPRDFLEHNGLDMQISTLACLAIEDGDPIGFLRSHLNLHNVCEYHLHEKAPLRFLLLLSDDRAGYALEAKAAAAGPSSLRPKPQQTAFLAIANRVTEGNAGFPSVTYANFCSGLRPCSFELAEGACVQALVLHCLACLPMYTLFNLLGQGYKIVLSGRQFGGVVAHALAAKLLLQVQHEMEMAKKMGIDLSALSRTGDKVVSFALCAPLFANSALQAALEARGLGANLHTVWRQRDASAAFLTQCGNWFSSLPTAGRGDGKPASRAALLPHTASSHFKALQRWAAVVQEELPKLQMPGQKRTDQHYSATPLDVADLAKAAGTSGGGDAGEHDGERNGRAGSGAGSLPADRGARGVASAVASSSGSGSAAGARLKAAALTVSVAAKPGRVTGGGEYSSPRASASGAVQGAKRAVTAAGSPRSSQAGPAGGASPAAASPVAAEPRTGAWRAPLQDLLTQGATLDESLQPVGQFWVLESSGGGSSSSGSAGAAPAAAAATAAAPSGSPLSSPKPSSKLKPPGSKASGAAPSAGEFELKELPPGKALATSLSWLSPGNKDLFSWWEYSLEELKRDLIEVYAWTTFKTTLEVDGKLMERTLRLTRMDIN